MKTLAHELGHVLLHSPAARYGAAGGSDPGDPGTRIAGATTTPTRTPTSTGHCRGTLEVEAESLAYLVAASAGLDTDGYTFAYVTGWAAAVEAATPEQVVRDTGTRVLAAARHVLEQVSPTPAPDLELAAAVADGREQTADLRARAAATR